MQPVQGRQVLWKGLSDRALESAQENLRSGKVTVMAVLVTSTRLRGGGGGGRGGSAGAVGSPLDQVDNIPHIGFMRDLTGRLRMLDMRWKVLGRAVNVS